MNNLTKEQQLILLGLIASIVVGILAMFLRPLFIASSENIKIETPAAEKSFVQQAKIIVHVSGAVRKEGVYKLKEGDRILDALEVAGGAQPFADLSSLNLAEQVKDGQKVIVLSKRPVVDGISGYPEIREPGTAAQKVNLNTAGEEALVSLPGIGKAAAKKIIEYRKANGSFVRIEQIMEIPRFGKAKFEKIKDKITL